MNNKIFRQPALVWPQMELLSSRLVKKHDDNIGQSWLSLKIWLYFHVFMKCFQYGYQFENFFNATLEFIWQHCEKNSRESTAECCMMEWDGSLV